jgi:AbrB family looped-hinge helix DNA binding protein
MFGKAACRPQWLDQPPQSTAAALYLAIVSLLLMNSLYYSASIQAENFMVAEAHPGTQTHSILRAQAVVSSKGQVTLPAAMRAQLGLEAGSRIRFELRDRQLVITPELPISAYRGILKGYDLGDIEPEKEPDREFD